MVSKVIRKKINSVMRNSQKIAVKEKRLLVRRKTVASFVARFEKIAAKREARIEAEKTALFIRVEKLAGKMVSGFGA